MVISKILVGSQYFFNDIDEFKPHDIDYVRIIDDSDNSFKYTRQISIGGTCYFDVKKMSKEELLNFTRNSKLPMVVGKFLVPEFCEFFGITLDDVKSLKNLIDNIDSRHTYERLIYNYYLENNAFTLTKEQRHNAFIEYKKSR